MISMVFSFSSTIFKSFSKENALNSLKEKFDQ
jgi:hypothetical protein